MRISIWTAVTVTTRKEGMNFLAGGDTGKTLYKDREPEPGETLRGLAMRQDTRASASEKKVYVISKRT